MKNCSNCKFLTTGRWCSVKKKGMFDIYSRNFCFKWEDRDE